MHGPDTKGPNWDCDGVGEVHVVILYRVGPLWQFARDSVCQEKIIGGPAQSGYNLQIF